MTRHKQKLRSLLINAITELCRKESFYLEELRIEGTLCVVSDRSSALIMQITEQVGEKTTSDTDPEDSAVQLLTVEAEEQSSSTHEEPSKLIASEVTLDKLDHSVGNWLLEEQHAQGNSILQQTMPVKPEGKHQCPFCPKRYRFKHSLKDHINKHTGNRPHHCKYCSLCFMHLGSLCAHVKRRHAQFMVSEYQCRICNEQFMSEQFLKQHYTWKHKGEKAPTSGTMTTGMMMNPGGVQYLSTMQDQSKIGASVTDPTKGLSGPLLPPWNNHVGDTGKHPDWNNQGQNGNGVIGADPGSGSGPPTAIVKSEPHFSSPDDFLHSRDASGQAPGSSVPFNAPAVNMGIHQMAQTLSMFSGFPFTRGCNPLSSFAPFTPSYQQNLVASVTSPDAGKIEDGSALIRSVDGKFQCPYCEKSYNFKHTLKDHINKHLGKRPHVCKHCGDTFVHLASLCAHIKRRHDEHMPTEFRCEICHEKLMNYQSLKQHYTWRHREARMFMEANEYLMFAANAAVANAGGSATDKDLGNQMTGQMFFAPGQSMESVDTTGGGDSCQAKKQKSDAVIANQDFDAVRAFDSLLPDEYAVASSSKNASSSVPDLGSSDPTDKCEQPQPDMFVESMMSGSEAVQHQMALVAEYFDEIDVQMPQGIFKYKCRVCGSMLKPQSNLSDHLNSHFSGRKPFADDSSMVGAPATGGETSTITCLGCSSKFRSTIELQHHLEANPDHLPQSWHH